MQSFENYVKTFGMWSKIYLGILAISIFVTGTFALYSYSWLGSIGNPETAAENYQNVSNLASLILWISSAVLLLLANVVLWKTRRAWAIWLTFAYFAAFIILRYFIFDNALLKFQQSKGLTESNFSFSPIFGVIFVILAAVIVYFNQFISLRLNEKMYPIKEIEGDSEIVEES